MRQPIANYVLLATAWAVVACARAPQVSEQPSSSEFERTVHRLTRQAASAPRAVLAEALALQAGLDQSATDAERCRIAIAIGEAHLSMGQNEEAVPVLESAVALAEQSGDEALLIAAKLPLAAVHSLFGAVETSRTEFEVCRRLAEKHGDARLRGVVANRIASSELSMGRLAQAVEHFSEAASALRIAGEEEMCLKVMFNLASAHCSLGHDQQAAATYLELLPAIERLGDAAALARALTSLASTCVILGDYESAMQHATRGLELAEAQGLQSLHAGLLMTLADIHIRNERFEEAREFAAKAVELAKGRGDKALEAIAMLSFARLETDRSSATRHVLSATEALEALGDEGNLVEGLEHLVWLHAKQEDYRKAFETEQRVSKLREKLSGGQVQARVVAIEAEHAASESRHKIELLEERQRVSELAASRQQRTLALVVVAFALVVVGSLFLFHGFRRRTQQRLSTAASARNHQVSMQLREIDRLKEHFLENSSRELKSPLLGISGLAQALINGARGVLPDDVRRDLEMIQSSGKQLAGLVEQILDLSRLQRSRPHLVLEPLDLHVVADIVLTLARGSLDGKPLQLVNGVARDLPRALAAGDRIQQVLANLVHNAIKSSDRGSVTVTAKVQHNELLVQVSDTGRGIAADRIDSLFSIGDGGDGSDATRGIGLAITKHVVELHGGKIWGESTPGMGATFSFTLPVCEVSGEGHSRNHRQSHVVQPKAPAATSTRQLQSPDPGRPTVLVVDDDPVVCSVLESHLTSDGYRVEVAADGLEAVARLRRDGIDLVLIDVLMPRMSGYELCRHVREQKTLEELPILLLSGMTSDDDHVAGLREGANDYLDKPIHREKLLARVRLHYSLMMAHRNRASEVKVLRGLLPICSHCKSIRDSFGRWSRLESYLSGHTEAQFSHGICPDCLVAHYPEMLDSID